MSAATIWQSFLDHNMGEQIPHCDQRVLHAPGECRFCDGHPDWQEARQRLGIAFTGHAPILTELECPADEARPKGAESYHGYWPGNVPKPAEGTVGS